MKASHTTGHNQYGRYATTRTAKYVEYHPVAANTKDEDIIINEVEYEQYDAAATTNSLPLSLYQNIADNPVAQCFIGFFGADGVSSAYGGRTCVGLRSTDFPFLFNLLKASGVSNPILRFQTNSREVSKTYRAARMGLVVWYNSVDRELVKARYDLGLPSSVIYDTNVPRATSFLFSLNQVSLLRLILFWFAGDGSVKIYPTFRESGESVIKFNGMQFAARDNHLLPLFREALQHVGLETSSFDVYKKTCDQKEVRTDINYMDINIQKENLVHIRRATMEALESIPPEILHPKLALLKNFLQSNDFCLPVNQHSTRVPFHDYIGHNMEDKLLWVLGQDFHCLNIYATNAILSFVGYPEIRRIQDFNLTKFKEYIMQITAATPKQAILLKYIETCKARMAESGPPLNVTPNTFRHECDHPLCLHVTVSPSQLEYCHKMIHDPQATLYYCDVPGCSFDTIHKYTVKHHKKRMHNPNVTRYHCQSPGCSFNTIYRLSINRHNERFHGPNVQIYECPFPSCSVVTNHSYYMEQHKMTHDPNAKIYYCNYPDCPFTTPYSTSLTLHRKAHVFNQERYDCKVHRCLFSTFDAISFKRHNQRHMQKHNDAHATKKRNKISSTAEQSSLQLNKKGAHHSKKKNRKRYSPY